MPTWVKVILIIIGVLFLGFVVTGFFAYRWVSGNKARFQAAISTGQTFGRGKDARECVDESLKRLGHGGLTVTLGARMFAKGCLETAIPSPALCETVPGATDMMAGAKWSVSECQRRGIADQQGCTQVLQEVVLHCDKARLKPGPVTKTSN